MKCLGDNTASLYALIEGLSAVKAQGSRRLLIKRRVSVCLIQPFWTVWHVDFEVGEGLLERSVGKEDTDTY